MSRRHDHSQVCWELLFNAHILPVSFQIYQTLKLFNCTMMEPCQPFKRIGKTPQQRAGVLADVECLTSEEQ
jgi:hypothetical protein